MQFFVIIRIKEKNAVIYDFEKITTGSEKEEGYILHFILSLTEILITISFWIGKQSNNFHLFTKTGTCINQILDLPVIRF